MYKKIQTPNLAGERLIGISLPIRDVLHAVSYDKYIVINLVTKEIFESRDDAENINKLKGMGRCIGLNLNDEISSSNGYEIKYQFDQKKDNQFIKITKEDVVVDEIMAQSMSGDWFKCSFAQDGKWLIICDPYDVTIYEIQYSNE